MSQKAPYSLMDRTLTAAVMPGETRYRARSAGSGSVLVFAAANQKPSASVAIKGWLTGGMATRCSTAPVVSETLSSSGPREVAES
jgi:hypothetical protein